MIKDVAIKNTVVMILIDMSMQIRGLCYIFDDKLATGIFLLVVWTINLIINICELFAMNKRIILGEIKIRR